jgi:hypothetical protein
MQSSNALVTPEINLTHIAKRAFQENGGIDVILADNGDNLRKTIFQVCLNQKSFSFATLCLLKKI